MLRYLDCIVVTEMLKSLTDAFEVYAALEYVRKHSTLVLEDWTS
jgi:hypothetical protein